MCRASRVLITAVAGAWLGFAADAWSQANLNPPNSLCLALRNASSLNAAGPCMSEDSECKSGPMPDGILQCTDEDLDPLDGGICVDQACYLPGSQIVVDLEVGPTDEPVCGTQVFLSWDVANLRFDGAVADFVFFHIDFGSWHFRWYVFNLADAAIVAGVLGLIYDAMFPRGAAKAP